jgi:hypothetical protein
MEIKERGDTRELRRSSIEEKKTLREETGPVTSILMSREVEVRSMVISIAEASAYRIRMYVASCAKG